MKNGKKATIMQILPSLKSGGVERGVIDVAKELQKQGYNPLVLSSGGDMTSLLNAAKIEHIKLDVKTKNPLKMFLNINKIAKIIKEKEVDLVHIRSRAPMISGYYACKKTNTKLVSTVHGPYSTGFKKESESKLKKFYNSFMIKSDAIICVSNFIKNYVIENYQDEKSGNLEQKITVIPRGVDLKAFNPDSIFINRTIELAKKWGLPEDKKIILFPARITSWKGHELLIEALKLVKSDFVCVFVGSDHGHENFRKKIEEKASQSGLEGKIKIVGTCKDMAVAYSLSNLVISASTKPEAFGRVAIEAQAMKKIIIATAIGGSLETIKDGETGFLVENNNPKEMAKAIKKALTMKEEEKNKICNNARKNIEDNFSNQKLCKSKIETYERILNS